MVKFEKCIELGIVSKIAMIESNTKLDERKYCDQNYIESSEREYIFKPLCKCNLCFLFTIPEFQTKKSWNPSVISSMHVTHGIHNQGAAPGLQRRRSGAATRRRKVQTLPGGTFLGQRKGFRKKLTCPVFIWSNYSDLTRVFTPNGGLVRDIPLFQGNLVKYYNLARFMGYSPQKFLENTS